MRTNRLASIIIGALGVCLLVGCKTESDSNATNTEVKGTATEMGKGDNVKSAQAKVVSDPSQVQEGGSYRLEPPDPNDPKFKPDPKLGGGG